MSKVENSVVHKIGSNGAYKAVVLLLLTFLFTATPIVGVCNVLCFVVCYFVSILALQSS